MFEFESEERRNQLFLEAGPAARQASDEVMQWIAEAGPTMAKWNEHAPD